ncbi:TPA: diacylglycerol kinase [Vibrio diabolicus]|uniref:diacylglycerol kinase n=1 Tax=Vibrio diabolicus subgroup TaxID=2315253 RepID=UPI000A18FCBE|nr:MULTISPECIES: diacylglycerol kinase [Vibrio diabolicus subgroup]MCR9628468.1 diacylglycerol kinase [Vibrio antiquarius]MCR9633620.1 diacylglycerol kinase [Vibrio antiquarius]MCS0390781.1 diacylglycerol kinase [Vibrio diabolicus]MCS0430580.1 diacylglycerol kinase [Vibrio diabolicus]MCZ0924089.1 diacylglycerol kinase [Vibrio diabolicus]
MSKTTPHQSQESGKPGNTGLKRIVKATGYSIQGLKAAFKHEAAIRQELALLSIAVILAWLVDVGMVERILMIGVVVLVLIVELVNSAIEAVVDRIGIERHELSGRAKDIGSAAVMVALVFAGFTWLYILASRYLG